MRSNSSSAEDSREYSTQNTCFDLCGANWPVIAQHNKTMTNDGIRERNMMTISSCSAAMEMPTIGRRKPAMANIWQVLSEHAEMARANWIWHVTNVVTHDTLPSLQWSIWLPTSDLDENGIVHFSAILINSKFYILRKQFNFKCSFAMSEFLPKVGRMYVAMDGGVVDPPRPPPHPPENCNWEPR